MFSHQLRARKLQVDKASSQDGPDFNMAWANIYGSGVEASSLVQVSCNDRLVFLIVYGFQDS